MALPLLARMRRELQLLESSPPDGCWAWPEHENRVDVVLADICGPTDSPYEAGVFRVEIKVPERFPFEPPQVRFITPIYHPNIDSGGRICLDTLKMPPKGSWTPSINLCTLLTTLRLLMADPNPDDPLVPEITEQYRSSHAQFLSTARQWTHKHAVSVSSSRKSTPATRRPGDKFNEHADELASQTELPPKHSAPSPQSTLQLSTAVQQEAEQEQAQLPQPRNHGATQEQKSLLSLPVEPEPNDGMPENPLEHEAQRQMRQQQQQQQQQQEPRRNARLNHDVIDVKDAEIQFVPSKPRRRFHVQDSDSDDDETCIPEAAAGSSTMSSGSWCQQRSTLDETPHQVPPTSALLSRGRAAARAEPPTVVTSIATGDPFAFGSESTSRSDAPMSASQLKRRATRALSLSSVGVVDALPTADVSEEALSDSSSVLMSKRARHEKPP